MTREAYIAAVLAQLPTKIVKDGVTIAVRVPASPSPSPSPSPAISVLWFVFIAVSGLVLGIVAALLK